MRIATPTRTACIAFMVVMVAACNALPFPTPSPPAAGDTTGVTVTISNSSLEDVHVLGLDPAGPHLVRSCEEWRWQIPAGLAFVDVVSSRRRVAVPIDVEANNGNDILFVVRLDGRIEPVLVPEGDLWSACDRGRGGRASVSP
jgi:hypothetical protein